MSTPMEQLLGIKFPPKTEPIRFHYGLNKFGCCLNCEAEINEDNPGKRVEYRNPDGSRHVDLVCLPCYTEPDYIEIIFAKEVISVTNFKPEE